MRAVTDSSTTLMPTWTKSGTSSKPHRFVNVAARLIILTFISAPSPFVLKEPSAVIKGTRPGFTRQEAAEFARGSQES